MIAQATAAAADEMCTTVPPATSSAPSLKSQPLGCQTQCASGLYTSSDHSVAKITYAENFMRSAIAPVMRPTVMIANIPWYIAKTDCGMVAASACAVPAMWLSPTICSPPMKGASAPAPSVNASE